MAGELSIAFVHPTVKRYRIPLFEGFAASHDVTFFITRQSQKSLVENDSKINYRAVDDLELFSELLNEEFDVIINPDFLFREAWISAIAGTLSDTRVVQWTEVWDMPYPSLGERQHKSLLLTGLNRMVDSYVVPGIKWKEYLLRNSPAEPEQIFIAPNASNVPAAETAPSKQKFGIDDGQYVVTYVGRLREVKRVEDVIKAVNRLRIDQPNVHLLVAGEGDDKYTEYLHALADDLNIDVTFLGWVENDLANLYKISDICVSPSRRDAFVLVVIEAMSLGTPMIVTEGVGAANEVVVHKENGYVVPIGDPLSIYECLDDFFGSSENQRYMSQRAKETAEKITYEDMIAGFEDAIIYATEGLRT